MKSFGLFMLILLAFIKGAFCCSCAGKGQITVEDFNSYDVIFIGRLIRESKVDTGAYIIRRQCVYKITRAYKGAITDDTISIFDAEDPGACGLGRMTVGRDYLIYAFNNNNNNKMMTGSCLRTTKIPYLSWPGDSATINGLMNLNSFGRLYDTARTNFFADTLFLNKHFPKTYNNSIQRFFNKDGSLSAEGRYVDGKPEGYWKYFKNIGIAQGKYVKGKKDSLWTEPYSKVMVYIREYRSGEHTLRETCFYDGKISSKDEPIENGEKWVACKYHSNGKLKFKAYAKPPQRGADGYLGSPVWDGVFNAFTDKGLLLETGMLKDGLSIGYWKYFYNDGKLRMEGDYVNGEKSGEWKIYYPNKRIKATGIYEHDEKNGTWKYFNEDGKEIPPDPELIKEDEDWFTYSK